MLYNFLTGPLLWLSVLIFIFGMAYKVYAYIKGLDAKLERVAYSTDKDRGIKGALSSIFKWLVPFATFGWRRQIFATLAFFFFHAGIVLLVFFLPGHGVIMREMIGFSLPSFAMWLADILTILAIIGGLMLIFRRVTLPEVRFLTNRHDVFVLGLTMLVLVSGALARFSAVGYDFWLCLHIFSGELVLILAPFTKLSHSVLYFMTRGQIGMDYAIKRGGAERGPAFPW